MIDDSNIELSNGYHMKVKPNLLPRGNPIVLALRAEFGAFDGDMDYDGGTSVR